jgi:hypothetical protein
LAWRRADQFDVCAGIASRSARLRRCQFPCPEPCARRRPPTRQPSVPSVVRRQSRSFRRISMLGLFSTRLRRCIMSQSDPYRKAPMTTARQLATAPSRVRSRAAACRRTTSRPGHEHPNNNDNANHSHRLAVGRLLS